MARKPAEALGAGTRTVVARAVSAAVVGTTFNRTVSANPRVFAYAGEVHAEAVLIAVVLALLLRAGYALPPFIADACAVAAVSVLSTLVRAFHLVASDALPVRIARATSASCVLVLLASAVDACIAPRIGAVFACPEGGAGTLAVFACAISGASRARLGRARHYVACFAHPVRVAGALAIIAARPVV